MKATLLLGKSGDIVSALPCLHADYLESGSPAPLIISRHYANILQGVDYVEPVVWPGDWQDVEGALLSAKRRYRDVAIPQMHSKNYLPKRQYPSFQLDQWQRCGRLKQWGTLPLVYPRSEESIGGKYILLGDHSESSKFPQIEDLHLALLAEFPHHRIVRLSSVRLPLLADLLALYDGADLLVTIDTLHAHLSAATKTPVIVLATDTPSRWHGTAFHPRMAFHLRYGEYELKKPQLLRVANQCVNKSALPVVKIQPTVKEYGYNLSLLPVGDKLWKTYRWHPEKSWRTDLNLIIGDQEVTIKPPSRYERFSLEDGRLFMLRGKPHISLTVARSRLPGQRADPCIQACAELSPDGRLSNWIEPKLGKNDWSGTEKNWCFWSYNNRLHVTYAHSPAHVVYELSDQGKPVHEYRTAMPVCPFGEPRGGSQPLPYGDHLLKFFHTNQVNKKSDSFWNYSIGCLVMESSPPFRVVKVSRHPILSGNELWSPAPFWKPKVAICYGAIATSDGFEVSLGLNDCQSAIATISKEHLNL